MFVSDKFIFLELHKTGTTYISGVLKALVGGEHVLKHNPARPDQLRGKVVLGSIRDPWDWYVSLWAYGSDGRGSLHNRIMRNSKAVELQSAYTDSKDAAAFREWLRMMHDPAQRRFFSRSYAKSSAADFVGFMTFRYLQLFCRKRKQKMPEFSSAAEIARYEEERCLVDHFIRNEDLSASLYRVLELTGVRVPEIRRTELFPARANASSRKKGTSHYYDEASAKLVEQSEWLIIDKFGYRPPQVQEERLQAAS